MSARQDLRELVDELSEAEAEQWLREMRKRGDPPTNDYTTSDGRLDRRGLLGLDLATRDRILRRWPAGVDMKLLEDLGPSDIDVARSIDE